MNHEQKRKKDLEAAKGWLAMAKENDNKIAIQILENLFPELRELEDERTRNEIIAFVEQSIHRGGGTPISQEQEDKWIAWLEKQGEQKTIMIQWTGDNLKELVHFTGKSPKFEEWFKTWEDFENYVHAHNNIFKLFNEDGSHFEIPVGAWIVKTPDGYNVPSCFKFIQKPSWSEEDEKMCQETIDWFEKKCFPYALESENPARESIKWLKSLKGNVQPQPKQEWSKKDEDAWRTLLFNFENMNQKYLWGDGENCYAIDIVNFLKSLNPQKHWKPSEEQMQALFEAKLASIKNREYFLGLLYEDLKKL